MPRYQTLQRMGKTIRRRKLTPEAKALANKRRAATWRRKAREAKAAARAAAGRAPKARQAKHRAHRGAFALGPARRHRLNGATPPEPAAPDLMGATLALTRGLAWICEAQHKGWIAAGPLDPGHESVVVALGALNGHGPAPA